MTDDQKTGYRKPPKKGQFKRGRSGNPRGRPKGTRNLKTDLAELLEKRIAVREDGEVRHISRQQAILLGLFDKAVRGDVKATNAIIAMCLKFDPPHEMRDAPRELPASDQAIIEDFLLHRAAKPKDDDHD